VLIKTVVFEVHGTLVLILVVFCILLPLIALVVFEYDVVSFGSAVRLVVVFVSVVALVVLADDDVVQVMFVVVVVLIVVVRVVELDVVSVVLVLVFVLVVVDVIVVDVVVVVVVNLEAAANMNLFGEVASRPETASMVASLRIAVVKSSTVP